MANLFWAAENSYNSIGHSGNSKSHAVKIVEETLNIEINTAYVARRKVQRMIREIIDRLEGPLAPPRAADAHGNEALAMIDSHPRLPR